MAESCGHENFDTAEPCGHGSEIMQISVGLFKTVSDIVGSECIVNLRRQGLDLADAFYNCDTSRTVLRIISGSRSEGFEFPSSDMDSVYVNRNASVWTTSVLSYLQTSRSQTLLGIVTEGVPPGYALIRCLSCDESDSRLFNALIWRHGVRYVSSYAIREAYMSTSLTATHGPCQSMRIFDRDSDFAYSLHFPVWPEQAMGFVRRSLDHCWPSYDVLTEICRDGCLLVPIYCRYQVCNEIMDLQWRISFSLAEKKIVHSMNYCQFVCYGLLKLFLKEVMKKTPTQETLLCSYYIKTAVFWEISDNPLGWSIEHFLLKFWNIFRRLIRWVSVGYCPNFFIPENNMFYGKIYGENRGMLLSVLREFYSDGYWCLWRMSSLNEKISMISSQPHFSHMMSHENNMSLIFIEREKRRLKVVLMFQIGCFMYDIKKIVTILNNTVALRLDSEEKMCAVNLKTNFIIQKYAESLFLSAHLSASCAIGSNNKEQYKKIKSANQLLLKTRTTLFMNYFMYAKSSYMEGNYLKTIKLLQFVKQKLQTHPYMYMYSWNLNDDIINDARQKGVPFDALVKSSVASHVRMDMKSSLLELIPECHAAVEYSRSGLLTIPPLVFTNLLLFLCYLKLDENSKLRAILRDLKYLLSNDESFHISWNQKAISWEILGICQQLIGDNSSACQSYSIALQDRHNYFKKATLDRITSCESTCCNLL